MGMIDYITGLYNWFNFPAPLFFPDFGGGGGTEMMEVEMGRSVVSDSLRPHGLQHARLPCLSPSPRVCSNWKFQPSTRLAFLDTSPHPKVASQNQSIHITRHLFCFHHLGRVLGALCREQGRRPSVYYFKSHITSLSSNDFLEIILGDKHSESSISLNIFILPSHRIDSLAEDSLLIILTTLLSFLAFSNWWKTGSTILFSGT